MSKITHKNTHAGFTLVEMLVAISILSLSITAAFTAVQQGIRSSTIAKDQITAFYMVQEAVEYVRNIRDENALHSIDGTPTNWLAGLASSESDPCYFGSTCIVDSPMKTVTTCSSECPHLRQDPVTGLYGYDPSWTETNFIRVLAFRPVSDDEVAVIVGVIWTDHSGVDQLFRIRESLFNH